MFRSPIRFNQRPSLQILTVILHVVTRFPHLSQILSWIVLYERSDGEVRRAHLGLRGTVMGYLQNILRPQTVLSVTVLLLLILV